jgi:hypothetical protein
MGRNVKVLMLDAVASERIEGDNADRSRLSDHCQSREAQFDVEGAICWRDPGAARCGDRP